MASPVLPHEINLFTETPMKTYYEEKYETTFMPVQNIDPFQGNLSFEIPSSSELFLDPASLQLELTVELKAKDGGTFGNNRYEIGPVRAGAAALFSQVELFMNNVKISTGSNYPYLSFLEMAVPYDDEAKTTNLALEGFYKSWSTWGQKGEFIGAANRSLNLLMKIRSPVSNINGRYLPPGINIRINLNRTDPEFYLIQYENETVKPRPDEVKNKTVFLAIKACRLHATRYKLTPSVSLEFENRLRQMPATIPVRRATVTSYTLQKSLNLQYIRGISNSTMPLRILLCFNKLSAYAGSLSTDPFLFGLNGISEIELLLDGQPLGVPHTIATPNDQASHPNLVHGVRTIQKLHSVSGLAPFQSNGYTVGDFFTDFAIFSFDLTKNNEAFNRGFILPTATNDISFKIRYNNPPTVETTAIIYSEFANNIRFDGYRNVSVDY